MVTIYYVDHLLGTRRPHVLTPIFGSIYRTDVKFELICHSFKEPHFGGQAREADSRPRVGQHTTVRQSLRRYLKRSIHHLANLGDHPAQLLAHRLKTR